MVVIFLPRQLAKPDPSSRPGYSFSTMGTLALSLKKAISLWVPSSDYQTGVLFGVMKKAFVAVCTCILALGGATVGTITGAIKGQTTEIGLVRGAGVGAVAGAVTAVQLMESMVNGEPFSKAALFCSLVNGKVFMEWVTPAVLKAYQWQISSNAETGFGEISDIFEVTATRGLAQDLIQKLPSFKICSTNTLPQIYHERTCSICLLDFKNGECTRILPNCRHSFHMQCIDEWLRRHGSCPICRKDV